MGELGSTQARSGFQIFSCRSICGCPAIRKTHIGRPKRSGDDNFDIVNRAQVQAEN